MDIKTRTKKTAGVSIFYWTKQTQSETAMEDKEDHYIIKKKKSIHQEDVTIIITYTNHQSTTKQTLTELRGKQIL